LNRTLHILFNERGGGYGCGSCGRSGLSGGQSTVPPREYVSIAFATASSLASPPTNPPRTTKLYDRTTDERTLDEIERIVI
jgi:hypothetical protein